MRRCSVFVWFLALCACGSGIKASSGFVATADTGIPDATASDIGTDTSLEVADAEISQDDAAVDTTGDTAADSVDASAVCQPKTKICIDNSAAICNAGGTGYDIAQTCVNAKCVSGFCIPLFCVPNSISCKGDLLLSCDATGKSQTSTNCAKGNQVCQVDKCVTISPVCLPNATTCVDFAVQTCIDDGASWKLSEDCQSEGKFCVGGACVLGDGCTAGTFMCDKNGNSLECGAGGTWVYGKTCGSSTPCFEGQCLELCVPGTTKCIWDGYSMQLTCNANGHGYGGSQACKTFGGADSICVDNAYCDSKGVACIQKFVAKDSSCDNYAGDCVIAKCDGAGTCDIKPNPCTDGLACTEDWCVLYFGCVNQVNAQACNDGDSCTTDYCLADNFSKGCNYQPTVGGPCTGLTWQGHCYEAFSLDTKWGYAVVNCAKSGGDLASLSSQAENDAVAAYVNQKLSAKTLTWIGMRRRQNGEIVDQRGMPLTYQPWQKNEPEKSLDYHYGAMINGQWELQPDLNGFVIPAGYVCERIPGETCQDETACANGASCNTAVCIPNTATNCNDTNPCTADSCDPASGCNHTDIANCVLDNSVWTTNWSCSDLPENWTTTFGDFKTFWGIDGSKVPQANGSNGCSPAFSSTPPMPCAVMAVAVTLTSAPLDIPEQTLGKPLTLLMEFKGDTDPPGQVQIALIDNAGVANPIGSVSTNVPSWTTLAFALNAFAGQKGVKLTWTYGDSPCWFYGGPPRIGTVTLLSGP